MPLYDFECPCGTVFEELVPMSRRKKATCPQCGGTAKQKISSVRLDPRLGLDPGFPTMIDRWDRTHRKAAILESRKVLN